LGLALSIGSHRVGLFYYLKTGAEPALETSWLHRTMKIVQQKNNIENCITVGFFS
jgi:hypothetical protein